MFDTSKIIQSLIACLLSILIFMASEMNCRLEAQEERLRALEIQQAQMIGAFKEKKVVEAIPSSAKTRENTAFLACKNN